MGKRMLSLSPHQMNRLNLACIPIREAFGHPPYLVGSVVRGGAYRDVDVRTILSDEEYDRLGFAPPDDDGASHRDPMWALLNAAISEWLSGLSGLPIDYQIQRMTEANAGHEGYRSALGILSVWEHRCEQEADRG